MFIFALRIQSDNYLRFDFFDRYFLNVGGRSRDQKCAFLGESRATISCRGLVRAASEINSGAVCKPPPEQKARLCSARRFDRALQLLRPSSPDGAFGQKVGRLGTPKRRRGKRVNRFFCNQLFVTIIGIYI